MRALAAVLLIAALSTSAATAKKKPAPKKAAPAKMTASETQRRIEAILSTREARGALWGIHVMQASGKRTVFELNSDQHFTPASNTKLFTTALALTRLGPDHRFVTTVRAERKVETEGRLRSDLRMIGGGDPTLSGRVYPYRKNAAQGDPLDPVEQLAEQVIRQGVKEIQGDIVGDDRLYLHSPYPEGWTVDDTIWEYGAPVSALPFNDNAFTLGLSAGAAAGDPARITLQPPFAPVIVDNRLTTVDGDTSQIAIDRAPGSRQVRVSGRIGRGGIGRRELLAVDDAAFYAASALYDVLTRRGVRISGGPVAVHREQATEIFDGSAGFEMARRVSPSLLEIARVVNKVSQNLHAEILLREVARVRGSEPSREAGLKEMAAFLKGIGIAEEAFHFEDGSGLSRRTLVTPRSVTSLLAFMDAGPSAAAWDTLMPIGGEDGSLASRFDKSPGASAIHAKTGSLATANALSGSLKTRRGQRLLFSIIANNQTGPPGEIRRVIDRIGLALLDWEGN